MKKISLFLIALSLLYFQSCDAVTDGTCNPTCNEWEECIKIDDEYDDIYECSAQTNRCTSQKDCEYPHRCDTKTNWCLGNCPTPCEGWEKCSLNDKCEASEDYCNSNDDCGDEKPVCNNDSHKCDYQCQTECESWQYCSENHICKANEGNNFCDENTSCKDNKTCDTSTHKCTYDHCNSNCESWQTCTENGECETSYGRCDPAVGCERNTGVSKTCNPTNNLCETDPGVCTPLCDLWQTCNAENECVAAIGYCSENADCANGLKCSAERICIPVGGLSACEVKSDCKDWEYCEDGRCKPEPESCNLSDDCNGEAVCNFISHQCEETCNTLCEYWEKCSDNGETCSINDDNFCLTNLNCDNNQECNINTHKCKDACDDQCESWGNCEVDGECSTNEGYCDETDDCGTTYGFSATCDLETHTCEEDPSNACDPFCESWEVCSANNQCELASDRCSNNTDCGAGKYCSRTSHTCKTEPSNGCAPACESWEYCAEGDVCTQIEGTCTNSSNCNGTDVCTNNECQDPDPSGCNPGCSGWEVCVDETCQTRDERCTNDSNCENSQTCNTTSHLCEYSGCNPDCEDWETCNNDTTCSSSDSRCSSNSDCPNGLFCSSSNHLCTEEEYCDGSEDCGTTYGFSATCDLETNTCEEDPSSDCDNFCEAWEVCNANNICEQADDRCDNNSDCGNGKYCSIATHTCKTEPSNGCAPACESWEYCAEGDVCTQIEGTCTNSSNCNGTDVCTNNECQDPDPSGCNPVCNGWEVCVSDTCEIRDERCTSDSNCENSQTCNTTSHLCEYSGCNITCQEWEICDQNNNCIENEGRCNDSGDCPSNKHCDINTHICKINDGGEACVPDCENWEQCSFGACILNDGSCISNSDCSDGEKCNENHECIGELVNGCSKDDDCDTTWQTCSSSKQCIPKEDYCSSHSDCNYTERCDYLSHECKSDCNPVCESWQECKPEGDNLQCVNEDGRCSEDSDCNNGDICNRDNICQPTCTPDCQAHQICNKEGVCEIFPGLCEDNNDCTVNGESCSENHQCTTECELSCEEWEECTLGFNEPSCQLASDRCSDHIYIGDTPNRNYGCGESTEYINISCDLTTHRCIEDKGLCNPTCNLWEECTFDNICETKPGKCNLNSDCFEGLICDIENNSCISGGIVTACVHADDCKEWEHCNEEGACSLNINACVKDVDCPDGRWCNTEINECIMDGDECFPACDNWEECYRGFCIPNLSEHNCNLRDYCGSYALCSSNTHKCEDMSDSCESCNPWEVCLETGCSLIFGFCNNQDDCGYSKICNTSSHKCENKSCTKDTDCNPLAFGTSDLICKEGVCRQAGIFELREFHDYNRNNLTLDQVTHAIAGHILAINDNPSKREIGFYLFQKMSNDRLRECDCDNNMENCQITSTTNIDLCPIQDYLYQGIYVSFLPELYDDVKKFKVGENLIGSVKYANHYGTSSVIGLKNQFYRTNADCEYGTADAEIICSRFEQHCTTNNICMDNIPFNPYAYDIRISQILKNNDNKAEAFESSLVNAVDNKPYTVIDNGSYRTKLKDSYDEEFYIDRELAGYSLNKGTGQCINNLCKKESWISCNKYCEYGFKLIQEDTDKNTHGDTCQNTNDGDNDGIINSADNCPFNYNPTQNDMDGDNKGDACDNDLDGDGWSNYDDNCPTVVNGNQEYTATCRESVSIPYHAHFNNGGNASGNITRNQDGSWNTIEGCEWSCDTGYSGATCSGCDAGYHSSGGSCVIDEICEDNTCTAEHKTVCNVVNGVTVCSCDSGYHASGSDCIINTKGAYYPPTNPSIVIPPIIRTGKWGNACNYTGDRDWDGVLDIEDNCPSTFNPDQGNYDADNHSEDIIADDLGDVCDPDIDGDKFLNNEDNCMYYWNPILCKICECNEAPLHEYDCTSDSNCSNIQVRGLDSGAGTCHYYETTLRKLSGVLKYEHDTPASRKTCVSNSDCDGGLTCKLFDDSDNAGGFCSSGSKSDNTEYIIMPRSNSDLIKCHNEDCTE